MRENWVKRARDYCLMFYWGGRTEQELARNLRGGKESESTVLAEKDLIV